MTRDMKSFSSIISSKRVVPAQLGCSPLASTKGTILDKGRARGSKGWLRCQGTQPVSGTLASLAADLLRLPYGLCHDIQFSITGPGSVPAPSLQAGMTEVEHVCSDATGMSDAASVEI